MSATTGFGIYTPCNFLAFGSTGIGGHGGGGVIDAGGNPELAPRGFGKAILWTNSLGTIYDWATVPAIGGEGSLIAQAAILAGLGISKSIGTGAILAQPAALAGSGISKSLGLGAILAQSAFISGSGISKSVATGALAAAIAAMNGSGEISGGPAITGSGSLIAAITHILGAGIVRDTWEPETVVGGTWSKESPGSSTWVSESPRSDTWTPEEGL